MRIAFVGVKRSFKELGSYVDDFVKYHLEIPYYYARDGQNEVCVVNDLSSTDLLHATESFSKSQGKLYFLTEEEYKDPAVKFDVVFHWRSWQEDLYKDAINVMLSQDHSYSNEWVNKVREAYEEGKLTGILVFKGWHKKNTQMETGLPDSALFEDTTFGVDTEVYKPSADKDPYTMLWASDPGRGLQHAITLATVLNSFDRRFKLHICYPDYVKNIPKFDHPSLVNHGNMKNGEELRALFNKAGILPYTSTFPEPSSRVHRQAQAAGSLVLYPPNMGTPSELIENNRTGIVEPIHGWPQRILKLVTSGEWKKIGDAAREFAIGESWTIQAGKFNALIERLQRKSK